MFAAQHLPQTMPARIRRTIALVCAGMLTVAASILIASPAYAAPVGPDAAGISYETNTSNNTATVTDYDSTYGAAVVIPDTITDGGDTYTITTIGVGAFQVNGLTSVTIPDSVTTIGNHAFAVNILTTATIGNSVTTIGNYAFAFNGLTTVTIPDSVTTIGNYAFAFNGLTTVTIPDSVTTIGDDAFRNNNLTTVTIPDSVTTIGQYAFQQNPLLESVVFQGPPPSMSTATATGGPLGNTSGMTVYYPSQFASGYDPGSTGFWEGYAVMVGATLNYDLGGHGTAIDSVTVIPGTPVPTAAAPVPAPTEAGYTFDGWFTTSTGSTPFDFTAPLAGDTTVYAHWSVAPATVTFNMGGHGTAIAPITGIPGDTITEPTDPTEAGYTFGGWYTTSTAGTVFDFTALLTGDTTVYAHWSAITVTDPVLPAADLPVTGVNLTPMAGTGILALLLGGMLLAWTRRRNHSTNT